MIFLIHSTDNYKESTIAQASLPGVYGIAATTCGLLGTTLGECITALSVRGIQRGAYGIVWGGLLVKNAKNAIVDVWFRMSQTQVRIVPEKKKTSWWNDVLESTPGTILQYVESEAKSGFCSVIGGTAGGITCDLLLPLIVSPVNPPSYHGDLWVPANDLNEDDTLFVSAGHVFVMHGATDYDTGKTRWMTRYYGMGPQYTHEWYR